MSSIKPWVALSVALAAFAVALARFVINDLLGDH